MKPGLHKSSNLLVLLTLLLGLTSCELLGIVPGVTPSSRTDQERLDVLKQQIDTEIGQPAARHTSQCKAIAFGSKPCGGPWTYLIYSTAVSDEAKLQRLVNEYNALERKLNEAEGRVSDCMLVMEPSVTLQNGVCRIRQH